MYSTSSAVCRSMFFNGLPLPGFRTVADASATQATQMGNLQSRVYGDILRAHAKVGDMAMYYTSSGLESIAQDTQRTQDFYLLIGSLLLLSCGLYVQCRSLWVTMLSVIGAAGTFLWANLVYRVLLNFASFSDYQVLSTLLLGLQAAFFSSIMFHPFAAAARHGRSLPACLQSACSSTSSVCMMVASIGTLSFFVCAATPFRSVQSFVVFCGVLTMTSYISARIYLPTVLATWHVPVWKTRSFRLMHTKRDVATALSEIETNQKFVPNFFRETFVESFIAHPAIRWFLISSSLILASIFLIAFAISLRVDQNQVIDYLH